MKLPFVESVLSTVLAKFPVSESHASVHLFHPILKLPHIHYATSATVISQRAYSMALARMLSALTIEIHQLRGTRSFSDKPITSRLKQPFAFTCLGYVEIENHPAECATEAVQ